MDNMDHDEDDYSPLFQRGDVRYGFVRDLNKEEDVQQFYLPHSCKEWKIGSLEDAEQFLSDLKEIIEMVKSNG